MRWDSSSRALRGGGWTSEEVNQTFEPLGSAIEAIFAAIGGAVQDPTVREDANNRAATLASLSLTRCPTLGRS